MTTHPHHFNTTFITTINNITRAFIASIADPTHTNPSTQLTLPQHAWIVATTPIGMGGLGIYDFEMRAIRMFTTPFAYTIGSFLTDIVPQRVHTT